LGIYLGRTEKAEEEVKPGPFPWDLFFSQRPINLRVRNLASIPFSFHAIPVPGTGPYFAASGLPLVEDKVLGSQGRVL